MRFERVALFIALLFLSPSLASVAQAAGVKYLISAGSGGQYQIVGGLPLPIQPVVTTGLGNATVTKTVFPPLLVPPVSNAILNQATPVGPGAKITVPRGVLSRPATQTTIGVFSQNPNLYAKCTDGASNTCHGMSSSSFDDRGEFE